jgi:hypothetical protein
MDPEASKNGKQYETNIFYRKSNEGGSYEYIRAEKTIRRSSDRISFLRNPRGWNKVVWLNAEDKNVDLCSMDLSKSIFDPEAYSVKCRSRTIDIATSNNAVIQ